jgi:molybdopterin-guanine dinucleotide biosynthesis protein
MRNTLVQVADATAASSPTTLGQMQAWLSNNEGRHWSLWPALGHVDLAGYDIISGTNDWTIGESGQDLVIANAGHTLATFTRAADTNAAPQILQATYADGALAMWVYADAPATRAPEVASCASLVPPVAWLPTATVSNTWPSTVDLNGTNCYYIVCAAPESSRLYRVFVERATTVPPTLTVRAIAGSGSGLTDIPISGVTGLQSALTGKLLSISTNGNYTITTNDCNQLLIYTGTSGTNSFFLPSVTNTDVGLQFHIAKAGAGHFVVDAADSDTIRDSGAGDTIYNSQTNETWATLHLVLITETQWAIAGFDGTWTTTD